MSKKGLKFGIASAAVIGAGAAVLRAKNKSGAKKAAETTTVTVSYTHLTLPTT